MSGGADVKSVVEWARGRVVKNYSSPEQGSREPELPFWWKLKSTRVSRSSEDFWQKSRFSALFSSLLTSIFKEIAQYDVFLRDIWLARPNLYRSRTMLRKETRAREGRRCYAAEGEKAYEWWLRRENARSKFAFVKGAKAALGKPKPQKLLGPRRFWMLNLLFCAAQPASCVAAWWVWRGWCMMILRKFRAMMIELWMIVQCQDDIVMHTAMLEYQQ